MQLESHIILRKRVGFDPFRRLSDAELALELNAIAESPVMNAVLEAAGTDMLVLNRHLQTVASNRRGSADGESPAIVPAFGQRIGELYGCAIAKEAPDGCGTADACSHCSALHVILSSMAGNKTASGECLMRTQNASGSGSEEYRLTATPIEMEERKFTVVSVKDISDTKRRELLERIFVHDLKNALTGLIGWSELLPGSPPEEMATTAARVSALARNIAEEIETHRLLTAAEAKRFTATFQDVTLEEVLLPLKSLFSRHELAYTKHVEIPSPIPEKILHTDPSVLRRVLVNMITNALEATPKGGTVRVGFTLNDGGDIFSVWNQESIPPDIAAHIFKRSFSTKASAGRGLGTYSMKIFGEDILGGNVSFTTDEKSGTEFRIRLPR